MAKINYYDVDALRNVNEKRVWDMLPFFLERNPNICACGGCALDIVAVTLNNIQPCYQVYEDGVERAREKVSEEEIYRQMTAAAKLVGSNPRHD
ncbi:competence protein ComFB [Geovibrio thiophilus]|uniref:Competence protein ComFB n=1 Tax=Geovibrio thiophilus TaxID=139438 RepID=A0A410JVY9_9BACT|nr:late competence development ComFB family protein [Geovibrio thiophilus]QAR32219.1 competence protein ComFB [Geovibrio thiophilus]